VLKGPSAVLFGRGSTGGIINQVSKTPKLTPFYEFSGTVGNGPQGRVAVDVNQPIGGSAALRLNLMGFKGETVGREYVDQQRLGTAPSFGIGLNGPTRFIASYYYLNDDNIPDYGFPYLLGKPVPTDRPVSSRIFYGIPNRDYEHDDIHIGTLRKDYAKVQEPIGWHPAPRSQLVLDPDPVTAEVVRWEPFAGQNMGRRLWAWVRQLHTGEAGGLPGQAIAFVASAGGAVLVWTGIALAWRRFRSWRRRSRSGEAAGPPGQEVSAD
jgi:outer membrane receptor for monomeric catechols